MLLVMSACSPGSSAFLPAVRTVPCFLQGMSNQEGRKHMARQTSKGMCTFCHRELSKAGMTRHLASCEQRAIAQAGTGSGQKAQKTRTFHLMVEGYRLPMYWMHLEVVAGTTLATLDQFLRDTWLECCGHLSAFEIGEELRFCAYG